jgi:hypothetical protein
MKLKICLRSEGLLMDRTGVYLTVKQGDLEPHKKVFIIIMTVEGLMELVSIVLEHHPTKDLQWQ